MRDLQQLLALDPLFEPVDRTPFGHLAFGQLLLELLLACLQLFAGLRRQMPAQEVAQLLAEPFDPSGTGFVTVAFVLVDGSVVEFMQYANPDEEGWF